MTNKIKVAAADVLVGDLIYDGHGANAHPTFAWEIVTEVKQMEGLILLIAGRLEPPHCEFWFEPDEEVAVIRHPPPEIAKPAPKSHHKHGHS